MTQKDLLKILLCSYGYDRNIQIEKYYGDEGVLGYHVYAENENEDIYEETNCEPLMFHIYCILNYMKEHNVGFKSEYWMICTKDVLNDSTRQSLINRWDKDEEELVRNIAKYKPLEDWKKQNNPCPSCTINKKDHWDIAHYNCELNHTHSCEILLNFYEEARVRQLEIANGE